MRGLIRPLQMACAGLVLLCACEAGAAQEAEAPSASAASSHVTYAPPLSTPASVESSCDPTEELFAAMFVGLTEAALSEAGIEPEELFAALEGNRDVLTQYLEVLGIPVDEAWVDAAMSAEGQRLLRDALGVGSVASSDATGFGCQ